MSDLPQRDSALIDAALDAARVTDDFVRGVVGLTAGAAGGGDDVSRNWTQRVLRGWIYSERHIVQGMSGAYGGDQLRKAANAADDLVVALDALRDARTRAGTDVHALVTRIGAAELPTLLRTAAGGQRVSDVKAAHQLLNRTIAALIEARTKALLLEMRAAGGGDPAE